MDIRLTLALVSAAVTVAIAGWTTTRTAKLNLQLAEVRSQSDATLEAWFIFGAFYASMVAAGYVVEFAFQPLGLVPTTRHANIGQTAPTWNYTTWLNIIFLLLAGALLWRFVTTGGRAMLAMMGGGPDDMADHKD